jgi:hypothetical protein
MTKHTPGPWHIRTNRHPQTDGLPWGWVDAAAPGVSQRLIPGVAVQWVRGDVSEANARLIAAAPELLEALRCLRRWMGPTGLDEEIDAAMRAADAAIAKATGG